MRPRQPNVFHELIPLTGRPLSNHILTCCFRTWFTIRSLWRFKDRTGGKTDFCRANPILMLISLAWGASTRKFCVHEFYPGVWFNFRVEMPEAHWRGSIGMELPFMIVAAPHKMPCHFIGE